MYLSLPNLLRESPRRRAHVHKVIGATITRWPGIRASVDALCRDDPSEISRDTRTKCLQTRRESLARPSKHTNNNF